jgi:hypothetical protein
MNVDALSIIIILTSFLIKLNLSLVSYFSIDICKRNTVVTVRSNYYLYLGVQAFRRHRSRSRQKRRPSTLYYYLSIHNYHHRGCTWMVAVLDPWRRECPSQGLLVVKISCECTKQNSKNLKNEKKKGKKGEQKV